jgi:hypothetical protein
VGGWWKCWIPSEIWKKNDINFAEGS